MGKAPNGRGIRPAVVVDHDDQVRRHEVRDLIQRFVGHAPGEGAVADYGYDESIDLLSQPRLGDAERIAGRGRRVAVLNEVVLRLFACRVSGEPTGLAQGGEVLGTTGNQLVHVRLRTGVPDAAVLRAVEHAVRRAEQLDG